MRHVQGLHISAALFSLDEIIVEPRLISANQINAADEDEAQRNLFSATIPYLPDWPELAARYSTKTISLAEALSAGANLVLQGNPGSGKTVALAHLVCQIVRREGSVGSLTKLLPIYFHIVDALPEGKYSSTPLKHIIEGVQSYSNSVSEARLERLISSSLENRQAILLVDGLDELSQPAHIEATSFIKSITEVYPQIRMVVSASPENISGLTELGLTPVAVAVWNQDQYVKFVHKWSRSWWRFIRPSMLSEVELIDPRLLNAWLLADHAVISPFDATMKAWSVFAGDVAGPHPTDAIESYVNRMTHNLKNSRNALQDFALQLVVSLEVSHNLRRGRGWQSDSVSTRDTDQVAQPKPPPAKRKLFDKATKNIAAVLPELLENGLLVERSHGRFSFSHPLFMAYLASCALSEAPVSHFLSSQSSWSGKNMTMLFQAATKDESPEINDILSQFDDPLLRDPLMVGRWLYYAPETISWRTKVLRFLANELQQNYHPASLRARLLSALLLSRDPGVSVLLKQISHTGIDDLRRMTALGMGFLRDPEACHRLGEILVDRSPLTCYAACLALVLIGNTQAQEILGSALLSEREQVRRSVAEALALDSQFGHEILKEASQIEDLLVRRAAVYGLAKVNHPWADEILEKMALEDDEWVVRSSATQLMEQKEVQDSQIPHPTPPLHEIPWLIAFAGERGMGIAPGKPAENLLLTALSEGSQMQQLAAMQYLRQFPNEDSLAILYNLLNSDSSVLKDGAYNTLWFYASHGTEIREPKRVY